MEGKIFDYHKQEVAANVALGSPAPTRAQALAKIKWCSRVWAVYLAFAS
jgi:hypothetical protein